MTRESLDLRFFDKGLVSNPDQEDIPLEAQTEGSVNLDVETAGKLKGIQTQSEHTSLGDESIAYGWIERADDSDIWDLVYATSDFSSSTGILKDFYKEVGISAASVDSDPAQVIIPNNQEVHLGMGKDNASKWAGWITHDQFNEGLARPAFITENAEPTQPGTSHTITEDTTHATLKTIAGTAATANFPLGYKHEYKISFIYDGYQESPLGGAKLETSMSSYLLQRGLKITIDDSSNLNSRITGVKVYRREQPYYDAGDWTSYGDYVSSINNIPTTRAIKDDLIEKELQRRYTFGGLGSWGEHKLIADIDINDSGWTTSSSDKVITVGDTNVVGATYYQNVGIDEDPYYDTVYYGLDYGLGTVVGNYLFVSEAKHERLPDDEAAHMIFRSKPYRYDTFDWVNDKLILPTIPKAMKSHRGKLYVWDENTTYIINPSTLAIEKEITGRGCPDERSVVATDYGLFWANKNGVYWSTLTEELIQPTKDNLSEDIKSQYQTAASSNTPILTYNSARNQLLVHLGQDVYAYNTVEKRWDFYDDFVETGTFMGAFIGKDGETYTTTSSGIYLDFDDSTRKAWVFISKEFTLDDPSQLKKFYKIASDYSGTVVVYYSTNGGSTWTIASTEDITITTAKTIMLKLAGTATGVLDSISIIYRRLRGKR